MLRVMSPGDLKGYCLKKPQGPQFELLAGAVTDITRDGRDFIVRLSGMAYGRWMSAYIRFSDREMSDRKMLATRLVASQVKRGDFLSVFLMHKNKERVALDFKFYGHWRFHGWAGEKNVFIGKIYNFSNDCAWFCDYSPRNGGKKTYSWQVCFEPQVMDSARRFLSQGNPFAICICGSQIGGTGQYLCHTFDVI